VYVVTPSETARNVIAGLNDADRTRLAEITQYVEQFLPVLRRAGFVRPTTFFGIDGLRYFDNAWPHLILMEIVEEQSRGKPGEIFFHLILRAAIDPPRQARP
jgi:hypothetical protein